MGRSVRHIQHLKKKAFAKLLLTPIPLTIPFADVSVVHEHLPPKSELPSVMHNVTSELVYCLSGTLFLTMGKKRYTLKKGSVVTIPPKTWHAFITKKTQSEALSIFYPALSWDDKPDVETRMKATRIE